MSQRLRYQRRFYLRPKFRRLQRLLGPAYTKSATPKASQWVAPTGSVVKAAEYLIRMIAGVIGLPLLLPFYRDWKFNAEQHC